MVAGSAGADEDFRPARPRRPLAAFLLLMSLGILVQLAWMLDVSSMLSDAFLFGGGGNATAAAVAANGQKTIDLIMTYAKGDDQNARFAAYLQELALIPYIATRAVRVFIYAIVDVDEAAALRALGGDTLSVEWGLRFEQLQHGVHKSIVPLAHIVKQYGDLADQLVFLNGDMAEEDHVGWQLDRSANSSTDFLPFNNYTLWHCDDSYPHTRLLFASTIRALCPREFAIAKTDQFLVSRTMIRRSPLRMYRNLMKHAIIEN
ncbi:hypothetical protein HK101_005982 [Irineochytrium annulatum]|nr:hypothetical protein HK101_005982 [Irineochytrium annulatum]